MSMIIIILFFIVRLLFCFLISMPVSVVYGLAWLIGQEEYVNRQWQKALNHIWTGIKENW